jgi:hypothetical protein
VKSQDPKIIMSTIVEYKVARHLTMAELEAGLDEIRQAPKDHGVLKLIVRRPAINERELLAAAELHPTQGLVGDTWIRRRSKTTPDGSPNPLMQLNVMNSRVTALVAEHKDRWQLAGDQLYLDMDLSQENLPAGTRLALGTALIEVTAPPHLGCQKFVARFGVEAMKFVNSPLGRQLNLRGINARVIDGGMVRLGDVATKV